MRLKRRIAAVGVIATSLTFGASASNADEELPVLATAEASDSTLGDSKLEVRSATRAENSDYVTIIWSVSNAGGDTFDVTELESETYNYEGMPASGVSVLDEQTQVRFHPLQDTNGLCVCAGSILPVNFIQQVDDGQHAPYWNSYLVPRDVESVSLEVPGFKPARDIPLN